MPPTADQAASTAAAPVLTAAPCGPDGAPSAAESSGFGRAGAGRSGGPGTALMPPGISLRDFYYILPEMVLTAGALLVLVADVLLPRGSRRAAVGDAGGARSPRWRRSCRSPTSTSRSRTA